MRVNVAASQLPSVGAEMSWVLYAPGSPMTMAGSGSTVVDLRGRIELRVEEHLAVARDDLRLKVLGFELSGDAGHVGTVTIRQAGEDVEMASTVEVMDADLPAYRTTLSLDALLSVQRPAVGMGSAPLLSCSPLVLIDGLMLQFPPHGDTFGLRNPVLFAVGDAARGDVAATLLSCMAGAAARD